MGLRPTNSDETSWGRRLRLRRVSGPAPVWIQLGPISSGAERVRGLYVGAKAPYPRWLTSEYGVCGAGNPDRSRLSAGLCDHDEERRESRSRLKGGCGQDWPPHVFSAVHALLIS